MKRAFRYLWRHPRRTGFALFNLGILAAIALCLAVLPNLGQGGVAELPNAVLIAAATGLLGFLLVAVWVAWGGLVAARRLHPHDAVSPGDSNVPTRSAASDRTGL
jgi:hypothetical protein